MMPSSCISHVMVGEVYVLRGATLYRWTSTKLQVMAMEPFLIAVAEEVDGRAGCTKVFKPKEENAVSSHLHGLSSRFGCSAILRVVMHQRWWKWSLARLQLGVPRDIRMYMRQPLKTKTYDVQCRFARTWAVRVRCVMVATTQSRA
jgi:hypothetical protein